MVEYARQIGWQPLDRKKALRERRGDGGRFLYDTLKQQLLALNPGVLDDQRVEEVIRQLNLLNSTIEGNRDALS
jgi:hypothetical protein